jgi:hypothetical protein
VFIGSLTPDFFLSFSIVTKPGIHEDKNDDSNYSGVIYGVLCSILVTVGVVIISIWIRR